MDLSADLRRALHLTGEHISEERAAAAMADALGLHYVDELHFEAMLALLFAAERVMQLGPSLADDPDQVAQAALRGVGRLSMAMQIQVAVGLGHGTLRINAPMDDLEFRLRTAVADLLTPHLQQLIGEWLERGVLHRRQSKVRYGRRSA